MINSKRMAGLLSVCLLLCAGVASANKIYTWTDEQGRVHFGDRAQPAHEAEEVTLEVQASYWQRADIRITDAGVSLTEAERARITADINAIYRFYDQKLYFDIYKTVPVTLHLFGKQSDYQAYIAEHGAIAEGIKGHLQTRTDGVYINGTDEIAVYLQEEREATFRTIKHEVSHAIVDTIAPMTPRWLNEGLAENIETLSGTDTALFLERHPSNFRWLLHYRDSGALLPIDKFLTLPSSQWQGLSRQSAYALRIQSGELVRLMLSSEPGVRFVSRLLHNYKRGDRTFAYYLVDRDYFGGLDRLRFGWLGWIERKQTRRIAL